MRKRRMRALKIKLAALCTAGMLFQATQCEMTNQQLLPQLVQSIATVFITGYVNDAFGVTTSPF
jgi:hypothetical protein